MESGLPHQHRTNGLCEVVIRVLRAYVRQYQTKSIPFKELISQAQYSMNTSTKSSMKTTPYYVEHLQDPLSKEDAELLNSLEPEEQNLAVKERTQRTIVPELKQKTEQKIELLQKTQDKLLKTQEQMVTRNPSTGNIKEFQVGDYVYIPKNLDDTTVTAKSSTQCFGPLKILSFDVNKSNVWLINPWVGESSKFKVHQDQLILYQGKKPVNREIDSKDNLSTTSWIRKEKRLQSKQQSS